MSETVGGASGVKKEKELQNSQSYYKLTQMVNNDPFGGMDRNGLSLKIVNLHNYDPSKNRKRIIPSEYDSHEGWVESLKNEKKTIME